MNLRICRHLRFATTSTHLANRTFIFISQQQASRARHSSRRQKEPLLEQPAIFITLQAQLDSGAEMPIFFPSMIIIYLLCTHMSLMLRVMQTNVAKSWPTEICLCDVFVGNCDFRSCFEWWRYSHLYQRFFYIALNILAVYF